MVKCMKYVYIEYIICCMYLLYIDLRHHVTINSESLFKYLKKCIIFIITQYIMDKPNIYILDS